jgi:hypothetical protein
MPLLDVVLGRVFDPGYQDLLTPARVDDRRDPQLEPLGVVTDGNLERACLERLFDGGPYGRSHDTEPVSGQHVGVVRARRMVGAGDQPPEEWVHGEYRESLRYDLGDQAWTRNGTDQQSRLSQFDRRARQKAGAHRVLRAHLPQSAGSGPY